MSVGVPVRLVACGWDSMVGDASNEVVSHVWQPFSYFVFRGLLTVRVLNAFNDANDHLCNVRFARLRDIDLLYYNGVILADRPFCQIDGYLVAFSPIVVLSDLLRFFAEGRDARRRRRRERGRGSFSRFRRLRGVRWLQVAGCRLRRADNVRCTPSWFVVYGWCCSCYGIFDGSIVLAQSTVVLFDSRVTAHSYYVISQLHDIARLSSGI